MNIYILSKWFLGYEDQRTLIQTNINRDFLPIADFDNLEIKLNDKIAFYNQGFDLIKNKLDSQYNNEPTKQILFINYLSYIINKIGGIITDKNIDYINTFINDNSIYILEWNKRPIYMYNIKPYMLNPNLLINCGWYIEGTRQALEGAILHYKPKTIVELGVYLAKSTCAILQCSAKNNININYYGFDLFTHIATQRDHCVNNPINKFFFNYPKLETAISNVAQYADNNNINYVNYDVHKSLDFLKERNIMPDLLYIDAIKNPTELKHLIKAYLSYNPKIIIVGDDLTANPRILDAIYNFNPRVFLNHAYVIANYDKKLKNIVWPEPISINTYPKLEFTPEEIKKIPNVYYEYLNALGHRTP